VVRTESETFFESGQIHPPDTMISGVLLELPKIGRQRSPRRNRSQVRLSSRYGSDHQSDLKRRLKKNASKPLTHVSICVECLEATQFGAGTYTSFCGYRRPCRRPILNATTAPLDARRCTNLSWSKHRVFSVSHPWLSVGCRLHYL
jgi:hypothetical protein